jgi:hypothetical protein
MRRDEDEAVDLRHLQRVELGRPTAGRPRQSTRAFERRLLNIERIEAGAAGVSEQHDFLESLAAEEIQSGGDIEQRDLVLEPQVVADRAGTL